MSLLEDHANRLAAALCRAIDEHGRPNSFSPRELHAFHGGPRPTIAGRIGARVAHFWPADRGAAPTYASRVFRVSLVLLTLSLPAAAQSLTGPARVIDGDSLEIAGQRIRLHGVDAPELSQTCTRKGFTYHCGAVALVRLETLVSGRPVTCAPSGRDRYERVVARCYVGDPHIDLGGWLVRQGLAVAYTRYSTDYLPQESVARGARLGIWSGAFVQPSEWRRGRR